MEDNKQIAPISENKAIMAGRMEWTRDQIDLIKKTVAKGTSDDELKLFLYTCQKTGLDPLIRQIYAVKRGGVSNQMSIQTGIDGYRLIAERTGKYAPGREPSFTEKDGRLVSATAYVKKLVQGEWHDVAATAFYAEYEQPTGPMWRKMPHVMLAKCAEALALRRAFPAEMSGVYTQEEMSQAEVVERHIPTIAKTAPIVEAEAVDSNEVDLAAKAEEAKARKAQMEADEAKKAPQKPVEAPKQEHHGLPPIPAQETLKGIIAAYYPPTGKGPHKFYIEGQYCQTFDEDKAATLKSHKDKEEEVEVVVHHVTSTNKITGQVYDNLEIDEIAVITPPVENANDW